MEAKPKKLSATKARAIVTECKERLQQSWEHDRHNRQEAAIDLRFLASDQWPQNVRSERESKNRPVLTVNRLPQFLYQVTNDIRQADLAVKAAPADDKQDKDLAKVYDAILRQIHNQSSAKHVYCNAVEHQASCGIGWFRVVTEYASDTAFDQEIRIKRVTNPLSVYDDPAAVEPDRADAMWRIVTEMIPKATFEAKYPKADLSEVDTPSDMQDTQIFWAADDMIRIAEYWRKVPFDQTLAVMQDGSTLDITDFSDEQLAFMPIVRTRQGTGYKIEQYIVSGSEVLEDPTEWPGRYIPIIPVIGAEVPMEKSRYRHGVIRFAREPQQLYNYYVSAAAESIALAPKAPYLVTPTMVEGNKQQWDRANVDNHPYLVYNPDNKAPGARPLREHPPEMPNAMINMAGIAAEDMKGTTGIYDAGLGKQGNETSGKAILARQHEGDVANYHFADNFERSLEHCGRVLIDLIPKIYDNERTIKILGDKDGDEDQFMPINQELMGEDGEPIMLNDLSAGRFDVKVSIGPSYSTKRMETANSMMDFIKAYPAAAEIGGDLIASALDFPGAEELAARMKKMLPPHITDDDPDAPPPEPPGPPEPHPLEAEKVESEIRKNNAAAMKTLAEIDALDGQMGNLGTEQPMPALGPVEPQFSEPPPPEPPIDAPLEPVPPDQQTIPPEIAEQLGLPG